MHVTRAAVARAPVLTGKLPIDVACHTDIDNNRPLRGYLRCGRIWADNFHNGANQKAMAPPRWHERAQRSKFRRLHHLHTTRGMLALQKLARCEKPWEDVGVKYACVKTYARTHRANRAYVPWYEYNILGVWVSVVVLPSRPSLPFHTILSLSWMWLHDLVLYWCLFHLWLPFQHLHCNAVCLFAGVWRCLL